MRQNNFDFLRIFFAFIVVIGHIIVISDLEVFQKYTPYFNTYVSITGFFCISGFLIAGSYIRSKSFKDYLKKRAARILPPYILIILLCAFGFSLISEYSFVDYFTSTQFYRYLAANLSFLNFLQPCLPGVFTGESSTYCFVNGSLWTIKIEVAFYLSIPVILYFAKRIKKKYILFATLYIVSVAYRLYLSHLGHSTGNHSYVILARQLPGFISYFSCGIAFYYYFDYFIKHKFHFLSIGIILYIFEMFMDIEILTPFALSCIIFSFAYSFKKLNNFGKYGDISYGIYIYHYPIIQLAINFGYFERYNPYIVALIVVLVVISTGFLSWHLLEKRFLKR
ncbi:acyltransferase [Paludibacter sp. 221]|uniref:acyltransferase family protein n=1 Tax=Paludibacter sp. 221 TaxID=2302939 RepID=UPI0013D5E384|nr:acyltransferase [Paludibacter sp. 221]NDV45922.1 acyltransferase [Paludibacter sp. 221]